jgi:hyperosmotically inducible periplasmic protein
MVDAPQQKGVTMKFLLAVMTSIAVLAGCAGMTSSGGSADAQKAAAAPVMDDTAVTTDVKAALAADPELKDQKINVQTEQGAVQLKGEIKSIVLRRKVETVVKAVKGVKSVDNQLVITG